MQGCTGARPRSDPYLSATHRLHHSEMTPRTPLHLFLTSLLFITLTPPSSSASPTSSSPSLSPLFIPSSHRTSSSSSPALSSPSSSTLHSSLADDPITDLLSDLFDSDGDDDDDDDLATFYLAHVQCRRCLRDNGLFNATCSAGLTSRRRVDDDNDDRSCCGAQCSLPDYQPLQAMQWCPTAVQSDWQGQCVDALASCPCPLNTSAPTPAPLTSASTCAADPPASKLTCVLCTLDAYHWVTSQSAVSSGDNYAGQCVASAPSTGLQPDSVVVGEMDGCPSFVKAAQDPQGRWRVLSFLLLFFLVTTSLCACWGVRRCWQWRVAGKMGKRGSVGAGDSPFFALTEAAEGSAESDEGRLGAGPEPLLSEGAEGGGAQQLSVQSAVYDGSR